TSRSAGSHGKAPLAPEDGAAARRPVTIAAARAAPGMVSLSAVLNRFPPRRPTMSNADRLPFVEAELNYLAPMSERPRYYAYEPEPGEPRSNLEPEPHLMRIHDLRPISAELDLDVQGFALVEQRRAVRDFWDDEEVRAVYYPE